MPVTKAIDWKGKKSLRGFSADYAVYPALTKKLDADDLEFNDSIINEIVLWKLGRFVQIHPATLQDLVGLKKLKHGEHKQAEPILKSLLSCNGVRLPMASTILRFANPNVFQICDRHICRAIYGTFEAVAPKEAAKAVDRYWKFLEELSKQCRALDIPFKDADRILFEFDKQVNPPLSGN